MELQRRRKEKPRVKKPVVRDCDFVIEEKKRYSGEYYGKHFKDDVCTDHPYHNHVLKIRDKEEIASEIEEALALEEIQRDYDDIVDIGDASAADNTRDSGFLSVKDIEDEPDLLAIDAVAEEFGDFTIHTIRADIESLTNRTALDDIDEIITTPENVGIEKDNKIEIPVIKEDEVETPPKQLVRESPKEVGVIATFKNPVVNGVREESREPCLKATVKDTFKISGQDSVVKPNKTNSLKNDVTSWEIPKKRSSLENRTSSINNRRDQEMTPSTKQAVRSESYSDIKSEWTVLEPEPVVRSQSVIEQRNDEETSSRRQSLKSDYSEIKGDWAPLEPESFESQSQSAAKRMSKEQTSSRRQSLKSETFSDMDSYTPNVTNISVTEETPSRRLSIRSDYSDIKDEWSPLEPETIYERDMARRMYRHSSQISRRSLQERFEKSKNRNGSFASATSFPISRSQSFASTTKSVASTYTTDSLGPRRKLRRSMSASFIHSVRSFRRSFRSSLRSLAGSLRSLAMGDESKTKRRRTQSLTSLRSESKSERKERKKTSFKRYSLESLSSRTYYDPSKSKLENDVAAFERRKKLMQGFSKQADYMEKCFDIKDRKDEPYSGSTNQYKECLTLCTKLDLELQRQKPLQEEDDYKHLPYMDQA